MSLLHHQIALKSGVSLHVAERGGSGYPVICLHGIWDEWRYFEPLAQSNAFGRRPMYLVDHRGHGDSEKPESGYRLTDYAADAVALVDALGAERVILAGHSLGALTSLLAAAEFPDKIEAMLLEDPPVPMRKENGGVFLGLLDLKQQSEESIIEEFRAWRPFLSREEASESARRLKQTADGVLREAGSRDANDIEIPVPNVRIPAPTLVIQAGIEEQRAFGPDGRMLLEAVIPNLTLEAIPDTSHNVQREKPDPYCAIVEEWFRDINT